MLPPQIKKIGLSYGIIGAIVMVTTYLIFWKTGNFLNPLISVFAHILWPLGFGFGAQIHAKISQKGFIQTREAVAAFFLAILLICIVESATIYLIYTQIDPELQNTVQDAAMKVYEERKAAGLTIPKPQKMDLSFQGFSLSTVMKILLLLVPGIIVGLILRKKRPQQV
ncbi:DUF4199 domain-containing protein [Nonlabens tegetincola]|uniref:DUF4199 domain-containing protein n=1 Tax=Nonlabens tegetincola TaxID=323273 RepID=UPI000CF465FA|nr:DUF4199 domain-containing protein [Nonlabens tegetincola]PQJ18340.1 hypothetical protein BST93_07535 [Nonlabens tegetincola]